MKGYYIYFGTESSGVLKKIDMQLEEIRKYADVKLLKVGMLSRSIISKIKARLPGFPLGFDYVSLKKAIINPDFIYIRRFTADCDYIDFLKYIKTQYPKCKVVIEIFTYPYDRDDYNKNFKHFLQQFPFYMKERHNRKKMIHYVDRFVTFSDDKKIFGIPTIITANGINVEGVSPISSIGSEKKNDGYELISVAHMQVHHGYERLLKGIGEYYRNGGNRELTYHIVGDGPETKRYKAIVKKYKIEEKVVFHGQKTGLELDDLYNHADIAIASLGLYKYGINMISTLKTSEYLAKGLPIVTGCKISTVNNILPPFMCEYPNNKSLIDINKLLDFLDKIYSNYTKQEIITANRDYVKKNMDISIVMRPIIRFFSIK